MRFVAAHNVTDGPVVIDHLGRVVGGHEWAPVSPDMTHVQSAVDRHHLVLLEDAPPGGISPEGPSAPHVAHAAAVSLTGKAAGLAKQSPVEHHKRAEDAALPHEHLGGDELIYLLTVAGPDEPAHTSEPAPKPEEANA